MSSKTVARFAVVLSLLCCLALPSRADELGDKGREIFKKYQPSVVTVEVVLKTKFSMPGMGGRANESRQEITGTVVDPSGLVVVSLSATDPSAMLEGMMGDGEMEFKMESELGDVKILLDDGAELPAEVVLRDRDLDLAFIRPKNKPANPMQAVDLGKSAGAQVLDQVVTLNRLGKAAGRAYAASVERINAVVQKPRLFYIPDSSMTATTLGSPAFALDGNVVGVFVLRTVSARGSDMSMMNPQSAYTSIILPAADIQKAAQQAPEAKGGTEKKEEAKEAE